MEGDKPVDVLSIRPVLVETDKEPQGLLVTHYYFPLQIGHQNLSLCFTEKGT